MSIYAEIGQSIVALRKSRDISQEQLALECDMAVSYLRSIEHGEANPSIRVLARIANVLDVELRNPLPEYALTGL